MNVGALADLVVASLKRSADKGPALIENDEERMSYSASNQESTDNESLTWFPGMSEPRQAARFLLQIADCFSKLQLLDVDLDNLCDSDFHYHSPDWAFRCFLGFLDQAKEIALSLTPT